ncbi:MAG: hypothetical protein CMO80_14030, partial [Verrucomicrobiales bacterium]|nr:hypothetical protein [Verrucomicrobiales bacterium]
KKKKKNFFFFFFFFFPLLNFFCKFFFFFFRQHVGGDFGPRLLFKFPVKHAIVFSFRILAVVNFGLNETRV